MTWHDLLITYRTPTSHLPTRPPPSFAQKHKSHELQLAELTEETGEKLEALSSDLAATRRNQQREIDGAKRDLAAALAEGLAAQEESVDRKLREQDQKLDRNQQVRRCGGEYGRRACGLGSKGVCWRALHWLKLIWQFQQR